MEILLWLLCAASACIIAHAKGRSGLGWFGLGVIFGLFALIVVAVLPSKDAQEQRAARTYGMAIGHFRICPVCAEAIRTEALKCRYCQSDVSALVP